MHYYMLTISEETESEYISQLKLWENTNGKVWIQIGSDDDDPYSTQGMAITKDDAVALIKELTRLVGYVPTSQIKAPAQEIQKPEGKQLTIDPAPTLPSRVNWGKVS